MLPGRAHLLITRTDGIAATPADIEFMVEFSWKRERRPVQPSHVITLKNIGYDNFKASIDDFEYHDACLDVWPRWAYEREAHRNGGV